MRINVFPKSIAMLALVNLPSKKSANAARERKKMA
jgi:hypothetical protein